MVLDKWSHREKVLSGVVAKRIIWWVSQGPWPENSFVMEASSNPAAKLLPPKIFICFFQRIVTFAMSVILTHPAKRR